MDIFTMYVVYASIFLLGFIALMIFVSKMVYLVRQAEAIIIERLGKYDRTLGPGLHMVMPLIERPRGAIWSFFEHIDGRRLQRSSFYVITN